MAAVVDWFNENRITPKSKRKESRLEKRIYHHNTSEEVELRTPESNPWDSLKMHGRLPCTRMNYCFLCTPSTDPDEYGVYVRRYTCTSCEHCREGDWLACTNVACGPWVFVGFCQKGRKRRANIPPAAAAKKKKKVERYVCQFCSASIQNVASNIKRHFKTAKCQRARGLAPQQH